jgi:hypothetical protein
MATIMKVTAFWDIAPCISYKLTDVSGLITASMIRAIDNFYETTWRSIPEGCDIHTLS